MVAPSQIAFMGIGMLPGTTDRFMCPQCFGGMKEEESLSVTMDDAGELHWLCFRASCGCKGGPQGKPAQYTKAKVKKPRYYTRSTSNLQYHQVQMFETLYGDGVAQDVTGYNTETDRFIFSVYGAEPGASTRGFIARSLSGDTPKSLNYNYKPAEPFIHFASGGYTQVAVPPTIIVVEDWLSATVVGVAGFTGVSINGTHLNQEMVNELTVEASRMRCEAILALDRDAFNKAVKYVAAYREQFPYGLKAALLVDDLKYLTGEQIRGAVHDGKYEFPGKECSGRAISGEGQL